MVQIGLILMVQYHKKIEVNELSTDWLKDLEGKCENKKKKKKKTVPFVGQVEGF